MSTPLVAFGGGILLGAILWRQGESVELDAAQERQDATSAVRMSSERTDDAPTATPSAVAPHPTELPDYLARLQVLVDLNATQQNKFLVPVIAGENLNDDFVSLFGLSSSETNRLADAIASARRKLAELEAQHAEIERSGDGEFTVTVPVFPAEGGAVHDELTETIRDTLGEQRLTYYETIGQSDFERSSAFGRFGLVDHQSPGDA